MRTLLLSALLLPGLIGCAATPAAATFAAGDAVAFDARIVSIDTAPWAYDGNAVVVVATGSRDVRVQLPARWNLCKAPPVDVQGLKVGDRVHVVARADDADSATVCDAPEHRLQRLGG